MNLFTAMSVFVAVAQSAGFSEAARRISMSTTAVSRHVAELEQMLGITLLRRTTRQISLTEAGAAYLPRAQAILDELEQLNSEISDTGSAPRGRLRITAPPAVGREWIAPLAVDFSESFPQIDIELNLTERIADLVAEGYDAAIRAGPLTSSTMIAHRLVEIPYRVCASPDYLERKGAPENPSAISEHDCIHWCSSTGDAVWTFRNDGGSQRVPIKGRLLISDFSVERDATLRGLGLSILPLVSIRDDLAAGRLIALLEDWTIDSSGLSLVRPATPFEPPKLRAFIDFMTTALRKLAREAAGPDGNVI